MRSAAVHHVHSFNQFLQHHLNSAVDHVLPHICAYDRCHERLQVLLQMTAIAIDYPVLTKDSQTIITPRECRERKITYSAPMSVSFKCGINGIDDRETITRAAGCLPIMVLSNRCHLSGLDEAGLTAAREVCGLRQGTFLLCIAD